MSIIPIADRIEALREFGHQEEEIAAILGYTWTALAAYVKDPSGSPLPQQDIQAKSVTLTANGGNAVLSASAGNALTVGGVAVTVP